MIGIVGGVGPHAGLDLMKKVFDHTLARALLRESFTEKLSPLR